MMMDKEEVIETIRCLYPIDSLALEKIEKYVDLLLKWNKSINLIGRSTIEDVWARHILDGAQLLQYIPSGTKNLLDIGSGGGIPAIIIAIMAKSKHVQKVHMVESRGKKASFLNEVIRTISVDNIQIHNCRIEDLPAWENEVVTARAFAPLTKILSYAEPFITKDSLCILPKGCKLEQEIVEARKCWDFNQIIESSIVPIVERSYILKINNIGRKINDA